MVAEVATRAGPVAMVVAGQDHALIWLWGVPEQTDVAVEAGAQGAGPPEVEAASGS